MIAHEAERIAAAVRQDVTRLLKEYARMGYKSVNGREEESFEKLWGQAFDADHAEEKPRD